MSTDPSTSRNSAYLSNRGAVTRYHRGGLRKWSSRGTSRWGTLVIYRTTVSVASLSPRGCVYRRFRSGCRYQRFI